jgi:thiamine-phosphate pyrophosphorylase
VHRPPSRPFVPILCYVTERSSLRGAPVHAREALLLKIASAVAAGVDWIQIREKDLAARDCATLTRAALDHALQPTSNAGGTRILVNDRLDVAISEKAAGVHLGEHSLPVEHARKLVNQHHLSGTPRFLVGVSCHSLDAAQAAAASGADYLFFGPVFATPAKAAFGPPQGLDRLAEVSRTVSIPVLAIGGITLGNAASCLAAGAAGLAAIRLFQDAADLPSLIHSLHALPLAPR